VLEELYEKYRAAVTQSVKDLVLEAETVSAVGAQGQGNFPIQYLV
jgi:hypothetical protein